MNKLSVVLATFNEEKNLPLCLQSVKDLADEIIVVDGTSKDKTVEIAKKFGAKVLVTSNPKNFHINKQKAIDLASNEWILQLDADELVSTELKEEIKGILEEKESKIGYWIPRKNWFLGKFLLKGGQYPDPTLRLYKKGKGKLPQKDIHEQAVVEGEVGSLKNPLSHYPYKSFRDYLRKWNNYNKFFAEQIRQEQKPKNLFGKLFSALNYLIFLPIYWFLLTFIRHKGFLDLWQGFVFSLFSALRFPASYLINVGWYKISIFSIIILSAVLRFYRFPDRWGLGGDDSRDALIALESIKRHELPLVGSFSSAGPFVFGSFFYWFLILSYLILPFLINAPWIFIGVVGVLNVLIFIYLGKILLGKSYSLILGFLVCVSPQLVVRSLMLSQHTLVLTFSLLSILSFVLLYQRKKILHAFFLGLFIGIALSVHYQSLNLLIFFPTVFFVPKVTLREKLFYFITMLVGFLIPSFPILYWDAHQNFANLNNILDYFLIAQYRIYVPNSWRIFLFSFLPWYWSFLIGRFYLVALLLSILSPFTFIYLFLKRKVKLELIILGIIFFIFLFLNRFYKGERSEGYLLYLAPFVLIFSALFFDFIFKVKQKYLKLLGILLFLTIIVGNSITIRNLYSDSPYNVFSDAAKNLISKYPNQKFTFYDYKYNLYNTSMAFSLIMSFEGKEDPNGIRLGFGCYGKGCPSGLRPVLKTGVLLLDLEKAKREDFSKKSKVWIKVNQENVYDDLIGWSKTYSLRSTFSLKNYIISKVGWL